MITHETILEKKAKIPWRIIDEEAVIVDLKSNTVLQLNDVARFIWESINGEVSVGHILDLVYESYDSDMNIIQNDGLKFLNTLIDKGLVYDIHIVSKHRLHSI